MLKNKIFLLIALSLLILPGLCLGGAPDWNLAMDKNCVQVYSRPMPGSDLLVFKAEGVIDADMEVLRCVLGDIPAYPNWMSNCRETSVLKKYDEDNYLVHYVQSLPWPIANRDVVLKASTEIRLDKGYVLVNLRSQNESNIVVDDSLVRMGDFEGSMLLEVLDPGRTKMTFTIHADPGGSLPARGVNAGALNVPYRTIIGMKKMVQKKKYIEAAASGRGNAKK